MYERLGAIVVRYWPVCLGGWLLVLTLALSIAPPLEQVVQTGEFAFLPSTSPSRVGEREFSRAFPEKARASSIAIVVHRVGEGNQLTPQDLDFVDDGLEGEIDIDGKFELKEKLWAIISKHAELYHASVDDAESPIVTFRDPQMGRFLMSPNKQATLLLIELKTEFLDTKNSPLIAEIEQLLHHDAELQESLPEGLQLDLSGTAVVGRDMLRAAKQSAQSTEKWTIILVVALLLAIYRAPLLALVPLTTVFVAVLLTLKLLCWAAARQWVVLFSGIESYTTVLLYGAGVDYCLFLIARYKEELDAGWPDSHGVSHALGRVGAAITASAGTVICGIGMMAFAEFGKFHEAGLAISFGLVIVLLAALTFTPALLALGRRAIFWSPFGDLHLSTGERVIPHQGSSNNHPELAAEREVSSANISPRESSGWMQSLWDHMGIWLFRRPWTIWVSSVLAILPFAIVGGYFYTHLSYGLLSDLPRTAPSVRGTHIVKEHFSAGMTGSLTLLLHSSIYDFTLQDGEQAGLVLIDQLTEYLRQHRESLKVSDVRSASHPFGGEERVLAIDSPARRKITTARALRHYVSRAEGYAAHWSRMEIIADVDPFSRDSIEHLNRLQRAIEEWLPSDVSIHMIGPTASIRDLKMVTDRDQVRINSLVVLGVFTILVLLLRQVGICLYLILSVLFSYLATLGVTYLVFRGIDGSDFAGLDWKVPMFLFTILIAVGEDYNIFLMSRIHEEQRVVGMVRGVIVALSRTGRIISSCGIIMAGTFASLAFGTLKGMIQLGFALAFGVLLDTFVVRPILVPAFLLLLYQSRWGALGQWLGGPAESLPDDLTTHPAAESLEARPPLRMG
ncbi:MAG: hypothetical protein KatS3mg113_0638 [Planctomycetaceae bacterium]|nr:MAG: hypothetical protein KatS3mg113_0638 [Planctomycetaceae bacterium]